MQTAASMTTDEPSETRRTIPREQDAPRLLIVLMIALMLLAVGGAYVWIERSGAAEHVIGRPAALAQEGPVFSLEEIQEEEVARNLVGRDVAIPNAPVHDVAGDWLFWVGTDSATAVPVILLGEQTARQRERQTEIRAGDVVSLFGTLHVVRDIASTDEFGRLSTQDRQRLERARIYISALRVEQVS